MIYYSIKPSNDTRESQKEKKRPILMLIFSKVIQKSRDQIRYSHLKASLWLGVTVELV